MGFLTFIGYCLFVALSIIALIWLFGSSVEAKKTEAMSPDELKEYMKKRQAALEASEKKWLSIQHGELNPAMICPHCQQKGNVRTRRVTRKRGVSGGKATAAVLTAGVSLLATGLSRKEGSTEAYCGICKSTWEF